MGDERDGAAPVSRPWPALAAAVVLGTAVGARLSPAAAAAAVEGGALGAGARVAVLVLAAGAALVAGARHPRRAWPAWLVTIALAAALRALPGEPAAGADATDAPSGRFAPVGTSIAGARDDERPSRRFLEPEGERRVHGRLEPRAGPDVRWTTTEGTLAAGERVVLLVDPRALTVAAAGAVDPDAGAAGLERDDEDVGSYGARHDAAREDGLGATPFSGPARGPIEPSRPPPARVALAPDEVVRVARAGDGPSARLARRLAGLRAAGLERLRELRDPTTRGLAAALLYGDRSALGQEPADVFVRTGTQHLLAVSGLHVALVAALVLGPVTALVRRLVAGRRGRGARSGRPGALPAGLAIGIAQALLVGAYVPLAGAQPPVVRAALCCGLAALALGARRPSSAAGERGAHDAGRRAFLRPDALSLWSLALVLECLGDPRATDELSVQLSYGATLGLVVGYAPLRRVLAARTGRPCIGELDRRGRPRAAWWRVPLVRLVEAGLSGVCVSCVAMLASLPYTWDAFGEVSPWSVVLTPLLVPLVAAFLAVGFALAPWPALAEPLLDALTRAVVTLLEAADRLPLTPFALPARPAWLVLVACALTLAALSARGRRAAADERGGRRGARGDDATDRFVELEGRSRGTAADRARHLVPRAAALAWALVLVPWAAAPRGLELWALDVGGGTAVALRAPGAGTWIFDAGSRDRSGVARGALAPLLSTWEPAAVGVVLSHEHADHHAALGWLLERRPVRLWAGALPAHLDERLPHAVPRLDLGRGAVSIALEPRGGLRIELLRGALGAGNEGSRALSLAYLGRRVLLTGDHEAEGLAALLEDGRADGPLEVLLLPHHGSESELFGPLLAAARPREAWISAGHLPAVARELDRRGLAWRWTARDGPLGLAIVPGEAGGARGRPGVVRRLGAVRGGPVVLPEPFSGPPSGPLPGPPPGTDRAQRRGSNGPDLIPPGTPERPLSSPKTGEPSR